MILTKINGDFATAILHCKAIEDEAIEQIKRICNHVREKPKENQTSQ